MKNKSLIKITIPLTLTLALWVGLAQAAPIDVTFVTSGSPGAYVLDFSVTNNLGVDQMDVYFFATKVDSGAISGIPPDWRNYGNYNPMDSAGIPPNQIYNNTWINDSVSTVPAMVQNGETLSGFKILVTAADAPASVEWVIAAAGWGTDPIFDVFYYGEGNLFLNPRYAILEGTATAAPVPEPSTMLLLGSGLAGLVGYGRRRMR